MGSQVPVIHPSFLKGPNRDYTPENCWNLKKSPICKGIWSNSLLWCSILIFRDVHRVEPLHWFQRSFVSWCRHQRLCVGYPKRSNLTISIRPGWGERHDVLESQSLGRAGSLGDCGLQGQQDAEEKNWTNDVFIWEYLSNGTKDNAFSNFMSLEFSMSLILIELDCWWFLLKVRSSFSNE